MKIQGENRSEVRAFAPTLAPRRPAVVAARTDFRILPQPHTAHAGFLVTNDGFNRLNGTSGICSGEAGGGASGNHTRLAKPGQVLFISDTRTRTTEPIRQNRHDARRLLAATVLISPR